MRRVPLAIVGVCLLAAGCAAFGARLPPGTTIGTFFDEPAGAPPLSASMAERQRALDHAARQRIDDELLVLRELVASSASLRTELKERSARIAERVRRRGEPGPLEAELVRETARWVLELDAVLYGLWTSYRAYLPYGSEPDPYAPARAASLLSRETRARGGLLALSAELVRLDNAAAVVAVLEENLAVAQLLNRGDRARGIPPESFDRLLGALRDPDHRALLRRHLDGARGAAAWLDQRAADDADLAFLLSLTRESRTARAVLEESAAGRQAIFAWTVLSRSAIGAASPLIEAWAWSRWGSAAKAPAPTRRLQATPGVAERMIDLLQPLDVVVVRDVRRGGAARGHVHALLHLGDLKALREGPLRDHPALALRAAELRRGRTFVVAGQTGLALVDLDDVLLAEDAAVLRLVAGPDEAAAAQRRALDALVDPSFLSPPALDEDEHAARLLAAALLEDGPGPAAGDPGAAARLGDLLRRAIAEGSAARVVLATRDGAVVDDAAAAGALAALLDRQPEPSAR